MTTKAIVIYRSDEYGVCECITKAPFIFFNDSVDPDAVIPSDQVIDTDVYESYAQYLLEEMGLCGM